MSPGQRAAGETATVAARHAQTRRNCADIWRTLTAMEAGDERREMRERDEEDTKRQRQERSAAVTMRFSL